MCSIPEKDGKDTFIKVEYGEIPPTMVNSIRSEEFWNEMFGWHFQHVKRKEEEEDKNRKQDTIFDDNDSKTQTKGPIAATPTVAEVLPLSAKQMFLSYWERSTFCRHPTCMYFGTASTWHYCSQHIPVGLKSKLLKPPQFKDIYSESFIRMCFEIPKYQFQVQRDKIDALKLLTSVTETKLDDWVMQVNNFFYDKHISPTDLDQLIENTLDILIPNIILTREIMRQRYEMLLSPFCTSKGYGTDSCQALNSESLSMINMLGRFMKTAIITPERLDVATMGLEKSAEIIATQFSRFLRLRQVKLTYMFRYGNQCDEVAEHFFSLTHRFSTGTDFRIVKEV